MRDGVVDGLACARRLVSPSVCSASLAAGAHALSLSLHAPSHQSTPFSAPSPAGTATRSRLLWPSHSACGHWPALPGRSDRCRGGHGPHDAYGVQVAVQTGAKGWAGARFMVYTTSPHTRLKSAPRPLTSFLSPHDPTILRTQPSLPITGTLASDDEADESGDELSVDQATNNIVAVPVPVPAEAAPRPTGALIDIGAPLPVYEDRGRPADTVPAPRGGKTGENSSAPVPATQSLTGPQGGGAPSLPPHFTPVHAPLTLVDRALGANWWEAVAGPGETVKEAGPSLLQPALGPAAPPPGPAFTDLPHEIVAFAHRASPSQVRRKGEERRGAGAG